MSSLDKKQVDILEFFYKNQESINKISKEEVDDLIFFTFSLLKMTPSDDLISKIATILYKICFTEEITLEEVWEIYWNLKSVLFSHSEAKIIDGSIRNLYTYIFESICEVIPDKYMYIPIDSRNKNKIVLVTSQLLSLGHAPTTRVFDYAYTLQNKLHKEVIIINDSAMNFIHNKNLEGSIVFNYIAEYDEIKYIEYKEETFRLIQCPHKMPDISAMIELIDIIYEINPILVYNIGADSLVSDYCTHFTTTVCLPCSNDIPISCSKYLTVGRKIVQEDERVINELLGYQEMVETLVNYEYRECDTEYTREQFGIDKNEFLIAVVGNRLDVEVTDSFVEIINQIFKQTKNCSVAFVGDIQNKSRIMDLIEQRDRVYILGSLNEASKLIKECDLYLNPKRSGGGRSSFEALYFGIPVVTLKFGDVYYSCGDEFAACTEENIIQLVNKYASDREFYEMMSKKARNRAEVLEDIEQTLNSVLCEIINKEKDQEKRHKEESTFDV